jgi:hypothetical protein
MSDLNQYDAIVIGSGIVCRGLLSRFPKFNRILRIGDTFNGGIF